MGRSMISRQFPLEIERIGMRYRRLVMNRRHKAKHKPDIVW